MAKSVRRKFFSFLGVVLVVAAFTIFYGVGIFIASEIYSFSKHGVEKKAKVAAFVKNVSSRGHLKYRYELRIDNYSVQKNFFNKLEVGATIQVLTLPHKKWKVLRGTKESSYLELFSNTMSGPVIAAILIFIYCLPIFLGLRFAPLFFSGLLKTKSRTKG